MTQKPQVSFEDLPINAGKTATQRREYWEKSRRLQHGTLVALWWEQPSEKHTSSNNSTAPCITFATISMRNEQQLAPREAGVKPHVGIRYHDLMKMSICVRLLPGKACCCKHMHASVCTHAIASGLSTVHRPPKIKCHSRASAKLDLNVVQKCLS